MKYFLTFLLTVFFASELLAKPIDYSQYFSPLPDTAENPENPTNQDKIALGFKLYNDPILSLARDISCNSCHRLDSFGVDGEPTSPGHKGQRGDRNSPSSFNAALHFTQFWDGRAKDVEEQAIGPILNPVEMAMPSEEAVLERLRAHPEYPSLFQQAFPDEKMALSYKNVGRAIGAFERTLLTPSAFDEYLKGDVNALSAEQMAGLKTFVETGCTACHSGALLGGHMYQKLGLVKPYPTNDTGRHKVTGEESDRHFFKVPSLRNVEKTGPYFHDGSVASLEKAIQLMAEHQLGKQLTGEQVASIASFLTSLTAEPKSSRK